jgi:hypothetical protein
VLIKSALGKKNPQQQNNAIKTRVVLDKMGSSMCVSIAKKVQNGSKMVLPGPSEAVEVAVLAIVAVHVGLCIYALIAPPTPGISDAT